MKNTTHQKQMQILLVGIVFLSVFAGCKKEPAPQPPAPEVTVAQPFQKNVRRYYDLTGNTESVEMVDVQARVEGFLQEIHFE
ncbi:MAG: efflux RND transporter periplasmic adaptor subunit, partial [Planctomycetota bacterium]